MQLVEKMTLQPFTCLYCGKGNVPNRNREIGPFVDLQRDVNFNETVYLCEPCAIRVGVSVGMLTPDEKREQAEEIEALEQQLHEAVAKFDRSDKKRRIAEKKLQVVGTSIKVVRAEKEKAGVQ